MPSNSPPTPVERLLNTWLAEPSIGPNIVHLQTSPARSAELMPIPDQLPGPLQQLLIDQGIISLYSHQVDAWDAVWAGDHVVVVTGTASGKTLCYNLPVFSAILDDPDARALYIFPTKALAQDQANLINRWVQNLSEDLRFGAGIYDGDTPNHFRSAIRKNARIILTNPDMLHTGILPHHTIWADFFRGLRYVVIDEIHTYRGVFGSHVANLIRRLKRLTRFYGSQPQFIMTSATIANPAAHAQKLIEAPVITIDHDGSPSGEKHFALYNPPIINPELGLRSGVLQESTRLMNDFLVYHLQTLQFVRTRRSVEIMLKLIGLSAGEGVVQGYRSGYLPAERRAVEAGLREGRLQGVVATNALELGIDIGSISAVILSGYPGTIASTRQQIGRAGRKSGDSLAVMVASPDPIDQFLVQHPEYFLEKSPEQALIDPDNLVILLNHIRCAAFELPFSRDEQYGSLDPSLLNGLLQVLQESGELHQSGPKAYWMADKYPAGQVSLRSSSPTTIVLHSSQEGEASGTVGIVDYESACWMVHPEAVYLHAGQAFLVEELDLENRTAQLKPFYGDYYTQPLSETSVEKINISIVENLGTYQKYLGDIKVTTQVKGFRKVRWYTNENLGEGVVSLPPGELFTVGYWLALTEETINALRQQGLWNSDPNDYGPGWEKLRQLVRRRDQFVCQVCGKPEQDGKAHHVHHKKPFRSFLSAVEANRMENLVTLCSTCHQRAEVNLRVRSGLSGLSYVFHNLSSLFLMCDINDLGTYADPQSSLADGSPVVAIYDMIPAGIGLSKALYEIDDQVFLEAVRLVEQCSCISGCPSCVGPGGENGAGGKNETLAILRSLNKRKIRE
jgi:DEAD/DEAH box helicase domain-containing protein